MVENFIEELNIIKNQKVSGSIASAYDSFLNFEYQFMFTPKSYTKTKSHISAKI